MTDAITFAADVVSQIFKEDTLTVSATYTPEGGSASTIKIIFDRELINSLLGGAEVYNTQPAAICKTSDVSSAKQDETLIINGTTYYIKDPGFDNYGVRLLELSMNVIGY